MIADRTNNKALTSSPIFDHLSFGISVSAVIDFIESRLPVFYKDCVSKSFNEHQLNDYLIRRLNQGIKANYPFCFAAEPRSDNKKEQARPDIGVYPSAEELGVSMFFYIEAKRLPPAEASRRYEYVVGNSSNGGGIERFKIGVHGKGQPQAGMIGYLEKDSFDSWLNHINEYISGLADGSITKNVSLEWATSEQLNFLNMNGLSARYYSKHKRDMEAPIILHHLWVNMS